MAKYVGVEIGGTKQQIALADAGGRLEKVISEKIPLPNGASDILNWIKQKLPLLVQDNSVKAAGIGFGGFIETATGIITTSVQVKGWKGFSFKNWFANEFKLPAVAVNDTVCGGYGELLFGSGRGYGNFFYTNIGTGIGGGMFINGKPYDGIGYGGAYLGHTYVPSWEHDSPLNAEKLENICSGAAVERRLRREGYVPENSVLLEMCNGNISEISCRMLGEAVSAGDVFSRSEIERWAESYAIALSNFITLYSPERVSIGGGFANLGEIILEPVRKNVDGLVLITAKDRYDIVRCELMEDAVIQGAVLFARDGFHPINE